MRDMKLTSSVIRFLGTRTAFCVEDISTVGRLIFALMLTFCNAVLGLPQYSNNRRQWHARREVNNKIGASTSGYDWSMSSLMTMEI